MHAWKSGEMEKWNRIYYDTNAVQPNKHRLISKSKLAIIFGLCSINDMKYKFAYNSNAKCMIEP